MQKYKAILEYDGSKYHGFQIQNDHITVMQDVLEAIYNVSRETITLNAAGRTDAGVHARGQVIDFTLQKPYPTYKLIEGLNFFLRHKYVRIVKISKVSVDFHARFLAKERIYEYLILNRNSPSILWDKRCWHVRYKLNLTEMRAAAALLCGEHDFTSFRNTECQSKSAVKRINMITISKKADIIKTTIAAPSFLHNQVRIMMGVLVDVAKGKITVATINDILRQKDRKAAGITAPPYGLYLNKVKY